MTHGTPKPAPAAPHPPAAPREASVGRVAPASGSVLITSEQLFAGAAEVQIDHRGALYRLKHTSSGKLILTK